MDNVSSQGIQNIIKSNPTLSNKEISEQFKIPFTIVRANSGAIKANITRANKKANQPANVSADKKAYNKAYYQQQKDKKK